MHIIFSKRLCKKCYRLFFWDGIYPNSNLKPIRHIDLTGRSICTNSRKKYILEVILGINIE